LWFPKERLPLVNGYFIMIGALGVVSATVPAEWMLQFVGWRTLFALLAALTLVCSGAIFAFVPEQDRTSEARSMGVFQIKRICADPRFRRLAPLSMMCISTAWALQGLWAASWFTDVDGLSHSAVVDRLLVMAIALSLSPVLLGLVAARLGRRGVQPKTILGATAVLFIGVQIVLLLRLPVPPLLIWTVISGTGAATVVSYTIVAEYFPTEISGQANSALNTLHIGGAFIIQTAIGLIVGMWAGKAGHYPPEAYRMAFAVDVVLQILALAWFLVPIGFSVGRAGPGVAPVAETTFVRERSADAV
jgi:MFS family permease